MCDLNGDRRCFEDILHPSKGFNCKKPGCRHRVWHEHPVMFPATEQDSNTEVSYDSPIQMG